MRRRNGKLGDQALVAASNAGHRKGSAFLEHLREVIRNRLSKIVAAIRNSDNLEPLHRCYGPIKYRYVLPAYRSVKRLIKPGSSAQGNDKASYQLWAKRCEKIRYNRESAVRNTERFTYKPKISIILPVYNTREEFLREAIDSLLCQYYARWELCICDDASTAPHVQRVLNEYAANDGRIRVAFSLENGGIAQASNRALSLSTGEFVGLLDHDDRLTPDALYEVVTTLQNIEADVIYSDEDRLDSSGQRCEPFFKPAWSPDLLLSCMYLAHFCVYRKSIVDGMGGFREGFDGSQDYDLALRCTEAASRIAHIPKILYHWRNVPTSASTPSKARLAVTEAGRRALVAALHRRQINGEVESERAYGFYRVKRKIASAGRVSIIIPTRGEFDRLRRCIASIESKTHYRNYEIIILGCGNWNAKTTGYLKRSPHHVIRLDSTFNLSRLNNLGARAARGDHLLFLNDNTEVIDAEWLTALLEESERPEVGAVGAKLLYRDGRIQHAGMILGLQGTARHAHRYVDGFSGMGYLNYPNVRRNYSAVTAACLMTRRDVFADAGGFDEEHLAVSHNDVDYCLRLHQRGYLVVYTPYARLYLQESATRRLEVDPAETAYMTATWKRELIDDPYYNPNLSSNREDFSMDFTKPEAMCCIYAHDPADKGLGRLEAGSSVGHEFFSSEDNLCAIGIDCEAKNRRNNGSLRLHLRESAQSRNDLALVEIDASTIADKRHCLFAFDSIHNSGGKRFYFDIEIASQASGCALSGWKSHSTGNAIGPHRKTHQQAQDCVSFRVYCLKQFRHINLPDRVIV